MPTEKGNKHSVKVLISVFTAILILTTICPIKNTDAIDDWHYIVGQAVYKNQGVADGAQVTVINQRTDEKLYDTVGPSGNSDTSGYYMVDLAYLTQGYQDGDTIIVDITGTGPYSTWQGANSTEVDNKTVSQILDVTLMPPNLQTNVTFEPQ